jgi:hypothetical protein
MSVVRNTKFTSDLFIVQKLTFVRKGGLFLLEVNVYIYRGRKAFSMRDGIWRILENKDSWISPFTFHRLNNLLAPFYIKVDSELNVNM